MEPEQFPWYNLQCLLQQQYTLTQSQAQQKNRFEKNLTSSLINFHTSFIQYIQQMDLTSKSIRKKKILEHEGFGNAYSFVKQVVLTLSKDYRIITEIIRKNDKNWSDKWKPISKLIINNLFEDIVQEQTNHKDIMYLMREILQILIKDQHNLNNIMFQKDTVSSHVLKDFTQRADIKKYSQLILKPTLLAISKIQHQLDLDMQQTQQSLKSKSKGKQQKPTKQSQQNPYKQFTRQYTQNWTKKYSLVLKQYDKTKGHNKLTQPQCWLVSKHLLYFLGVSDQASIPTFQLIKVQQKLEPFTSDVYLNRNDSSFKSQQLSDNLSTIRNIICCFFGQAFKYIYNMPTTIRLICKLIQQTLIECDKDIKHQYIIKCVSNFLFKTWLLPQLKSQDRTLAAQLKNTVMQKNVEFISEMITRIINGVQAVKDRPYKNEINIIVSQLKQSVQNYLQQILKCDCDKVKNLISRTRYQRIRSYSICINYKEMRTLFQMILESQQYIVVMNPTIVNRTIRIRDMTDNFAIFRGKVGDQEDDGSLNYVLFSELALPKHLQSDYFRTYIDTYKNHKAKNLLRKILISLDPSDTQLFKKNSLKRFLTNLQKSSKYKTDFVGFDKIPMNIKVRYLLSLKITDYISLGKQMLTQLNQRKPVIQSLYNQTKNQFLRASDSVRKYNQKVSQQQIKLNVARKLQRLNEFIQTATINKCLTSPKIRSAPSLFKSFVTKNPYTQEKQKIWLQDPKCCYHTSSENDQNTQHITNISQFLKTFASLPEVAACVYTGDDKVGIRNTFFDFIKNIIFMIKFDPKSNAILLEDENWLTQSLQKILTRRLYEKIYPKHMTYNDTALYFRLKTLDWILPQNLNIVYNMQTDPLWKIAASSLNQFDSFKTPSQKMQCIVACWEVMNHILKLTMDKNDTANADTTMALMQYIILKAAPRRLHSNINFISIFYQSNKMLSGSGYAFTQLQIAINLLQILNQKNLQGITQLIYKKMIYQKQIQYGMYFLQKRPRADKQPTGKSIKDLFNIRFN